MIEDSAYVLERCPCEAGHVESQTEEMGVEEWCEERVPEEECSDEDTCKDCYFRVGYEAHCWIVVFLDPWRCETEEGGKREW